MNLRPRQHYLTRYPQLNQAIRDPRTSCPGDRTLDRAAHDPRRLVRTRPKGKLRSTISILVLAASWTIIGLVSAYDSYLTIKLSEHMVELNPLGRWLMQLDDGSVAFFIACKFVGTMAVLGVILLLYVWRERWGLVIGSTLAALQTCLALLLTYG